MFINFDLNNWGNTLQSSCYSNQDKTKVNFQGLRNGVACVVDNFSNRVAVGRNKFLYTAGLDNGLLPHGTLMLEHIRSIINPHHFKIRCINVSMLNPSESSETEKLALGIRTAIKKLSETTNLTKKAPKVINLASASTYRFSDFSNIMNVFNNKELLEELSANNKILTTDLISETAREKHIQGISLNPTNINLYRDEIYNFLENIKVPENCDEQDIRIALKRDLSVVKALKESIEKGIIVFNSAGNDGKKYFNIYNIPTGINSVGAYDIVGNVAPISCQNSLVTCFENGALTVIPEVQDHSIVGLRINNDPRVLRAKKNVPCENLPVLDHFIGKNISEVIASQEDFAHLNSILNATDVFKCRPNMPLGELISMLSKNDEIKNIGKIFKTEELAKLYHFPQNYIDILKAKGEYTTAAFNCFFKKTDKNVIVPGVIDDLIGTSGACANATAEYLKSHKVA